MSKPFKLRRQPTRRYPDWSEDGQTYSINGIGYALTEDLRTCRESAQNQNLVALNTIRGVKYEEARRIKS